MSPRILFVVDAGPQVGGGPVTRCLALAQALAPPAARCLFLAPPAVAHLLGAFGPEAQHVPADSTAFEDLLEATRSLDYDAVVFDHTGLTRPEHQALARGRPAMVLDDRADRPLGGEVIVDPGLGREPQHYDRLRLAETDLLIGPDYALVRPEFAQVREAALARRGGPVQRVLVDMGLMDPGAVTAKVLERLRQRGHLAIDIAVGGAAATLPALSRIAAHDSRLELHVDAPDRARLIARADLGVGGAGVAVWERCVLGLPSIAVVLDPAQRRMGQELAERGAAVVLDLTDPEFEAGLDRAVVRLMNDAAARARLAAASAEIADGQGAPRVAKALLDLIGSRAPLLI
jgi:UDP-2,4-diacetamido-2,4,6-trideoxy-beta-L-altropyranose hydrolase